jgi:hypothetical protein
MVAMSTVGRLLFVVLIGVGHALGCVCAAWPSAKDAWQDSPVVFIGHVDETLTSMLTGEQTARVRVEESFKGLKDGQTLVLKQASNDCSPRFTRGGRVLFYLYPGDKSATWNARGCHRSRPIEEAADDLMFLRALPRSATGTRISGEVELYEQSPEKGFRRVGGLPAVHVTISSEQRTVETTTNGDGVYEVYDLPPAKYRVDIAVPPNLKIHFPLVTGAATRDPSSRQPEAELSEGKGVSIGFVLMEDNRVSGHVFGPEGAAMRDVCLELEPAMSPPKINLAPRACTNKEGRFSIETVPSGEYFIVANRLGRMTAAVPFPTMDFPGTTARQKATKVTLHSGDHVENLDFRVPTLAKTIRLAGRLLFSDGLPASDSQVLFKSSEESVTKLTSADGSFAFSVLAGKPGNIRGSIMVFRGTDTKCPQFRAKFNPKGLLANVETTPIELDTVSDQIAVRLILPFPSCKDWPAR